jgi:hypothetical protein
MNKAAFILSAQIETYQKANTIFKADITPLD